MVKKREAEIPVTAGSGNVFADLGFENPEEELTKAQLASQIWHAIKRRRLTQEGGGGTHGHRSAESIGAPQWKTFELLQRTPDAPADRAWP